MFVIFFQNDVFNVCLQENLNKTHHTATRKSVCSNRTRNSTAPPVTAMKMPTRARECLALRFRQNWMAKHPVDMPNNGAPLDDSLTSLSWLQNLNIMKTLNPTPPASPDPDISGQNIAELFKQRPGDARVNPNAILNMAHHQHPTKHDSMQGSHNNHVFSHRASTHAHHYSSGGLEVAPPLATSFNQYHDKIDYKTNSSVNPHTPMLLSSAWR